jgi:hypothetical protein
MGQEAISNFPPYQKDPPRPNPLFRNTSGAGNHYLQIMVDASNAPGVNRHGVGSQVFIYETGYAGDPGHLLGMQEIQVSNGYSSGTEAIAHFGLGKRESVDVQVVLPWGAGTWTVHDVEANQRLVVTSPDTPAGPTVTQVLVGASGWTQDFLNGLAAAGMGVGGFAPATGSDQQLLAMPWNNLNQLAIRFSEPVQVQASHLTLHGLNVGPYAFSGFAYDADTYLATWTLEQPLGADRLLLTLSDQVTDLLGNPLDGEWLNGASVYPSGNGEPGGDFHFLFNVLPGDVNRNGQVNVFDSVDVRGRWNAAAGDSLYSPFADINGNGTINVFDSAPVRAAWNTSLPVGEPTPSLTPLRLLHETSQLPLPTPQLAAAPAARGAAPLGLPPLLELAQQHRLTLKPVLLDGLELPLPGPLLEAAR